MQRPTKLGPAMMFNEVEGYPGWRVLVGLMASRDRVGMLLDCPPRELTQRMGHALANPIPPVDVGPDRAPCQEVVHRADDPDFDLGYHVRRSALPRPGSIDQLRELTARIMSRRLDPSRPLWEAYFVEGLEGGRVALLSKSHQALVDGISTVDLGFSVKGAHTLWWGGCAWDSFAIPHLVDAEPSVLVATRCPACDAALSWVVDRTEPPTGDQVAHRPGRQHLAGLRGVHDASEEEAQPALVSPVPWRG